MIFMLLHIDYQWLTSGETPPKNHLVFIEGFTLFYCLIFNKLYLWNRIGETLSPKSFHFFKRTLRRGGAEVLLEHGFHRLKGFVAYALD